MKMMSRKFCFVCIGLFTLISHTTFATDCPSISLQEYAVQSIEPLFKEPINLDTDSRMPFLGKVIESNCSKKDAACKVVFKVKEQFWDNEKLASDALSQILGIKIPSQPIEEISVSFTDISDINFTVGSDWFVIPSHYGSRDGKGNGFVFDTFCGNSLARYKDRKLILMDNTVMRYAYVRNSLYKLITPESLERYKLKLIEEFAKRKNYNLAD